MSQITIIGGGIAGLAAAYRLHQLAPTAAITLIERAPYLGGKIITEQLNLTGVGSFVIEGAPDSFLSRKTAAVDLCRELGLADRLVGRDPQHAQTFVKQGEHFHRLPEGLTGLIPTDFAALERSTILSPAGKARLMAEVDLPPLALPSPDWDESVADFISRRFGTEAYERMMEPLLSGIYGGDGRELSLLATFANLRQLEQRHGSVIGGLQARPEQPTMSAQLPPFVSLPGGMGELVAALLARLDGVQLRTDTAVAALERAATGYRLTLTDGRTQHADAVILATPAFVTAQLLASIAPELAQLHAAIPYGSSATISLVYPRAVFDQLSTFDQLPSYQQVLNGYGYVIPRVEDTDILACTWTSNKWQGRAPADYVLLRVYAGRVGRRDVTDLSDAELLQMARTEVIASTGAEPSKVSAPLGWRIYRWPRSMPQYLLDHGKRVAQIEKLAAATPGIFLAGAAYRGVGLPDCIQSGEQAARALLAELL